MANFTPRNGAYSPKSIYSYKTFTQYAWNHFAPETDGNCTWFAFGETSRIVQQCLNDESYNIQYTSGNEFMTYGPNALLWISNAHNKGTWDTYGDTRGNYNPSSSSQYGNQISIQEGDILCYWSSDGYGHVEIAERISGNYVYCSGSKAQGQQAAVLYYERTVALSQFTVGRQHTFSGEDVNGNVISWSNDYFQGVIRNPYVTGQSQSVTPEINITPTYYNKTMASNEDYVDFQFSIVMTGIPSGYSASGNNTFPGLSRVQNTGWSYTDYTVDGVTYRRATKTQTLRYEREYNYAYSTTKYMYFNIDYPNGSLISTTRMNINVQAKSGGGGTSTLIHWVSSFKRNSKKKFTALLK